MNQGSFRLRFALSAVLAFFLLSLFLLAGFGKARESAEVRDLQNSLLTSARLLRSAPPLPGTFGDLPWRVSWFDSNSVLVADSSFSLGSVTEVDPQPELEAAHISGEGLSQRFSSVAGKQMLFVAIRIDSTDEGPTYLRLGAPMPSAPVEWWIAGTVFLVVQVALSLILALAYWWSRRRAATMVSAILKRGMSFALGEPVEREYLQGPSPWPLVSTTLNRMYDLIDSRLNQYRQERDEQAAILNGMVEAVIVLDNQLHIKGLNPAARRVFPTGRSPEGMSLIAATRSSALDDLARELQGSGESSTRGEIVLADLETTLQVQGASLRSAAGVMWGSVLVMSDITQLKRLEMMRRDFVANVSHELKTPITNIKGYVETLLEGEVPAAKARSFLEVVNRHAQRLSLIVDDLLILTRLENSPPEDGELRSVRMRDLVEGIVAQTSDRAAAGAIRIELQLPKKPLLVTAFPLLLEQAVINLVDNAIKFCPPHSRIWISARITDGQIELEVRDNGPGIPEREQQRVFERFYRATEGRSREGTGLGLSIVKHIVHIHRGTIVLTSPPIGEVTGTSFVIRLPQELESEIDLTTDSGSGPAGR